MKCLKNYQLEKLPAVTECFQVIEFWKELKDLNEKGKDSNENFPGFPLAEMMYAVYITGV